MLNMFSIEKNGIATDIDFFHKLYDDIIKLYQNNPSYRITTYEDTAYKAKIERMPEEFDELVNSINNALDSTSLTFATFRIKDFMCKIDVKIYTKEMGESALELLVYNNLKTICYNPSTNKYYLENNGRPSKKIVFFSKTSVYSQNAKDKLYPTNFKDLAVFPQEIIALLLPHFTKTKIWKDFIDDNFYPPVKLNELPLFFNRKNYLEKTFGLDLPKSVNKMPLNQSYAICCAIKYVKPEHQHLMFSIKIDFDEKYNISKLECKIIAKKYLKSLLSTRMQAVKLDENIINDYIDFSLQQSTPIDILAGKKKIIDLHNQLAEEITRKSYRCGKITFPETPLKYLRLPKEFLLLKTQKALIEEGKINHNCVGGYGKKIIAGKCVIYSANIQDEHLTIEIMFKQTKNRYKFYVAQCYKAYNRPCSDEALAYVKECIDNCSEIAIAQYLKRQKKKK